MPLTITASQHIATRGLILLLAMLLFAGCSTNVEVKGTIPVALSHRLPLHAGLVLDPALRSYTYTREKGKKVSFDIGKAQTGMFSSVGGSMFDQVTILEQLPKPGGDVDLLLYPSVEEIQLATPFETRLKVYEVWIKYNLRVFSGDGEPLSDWIMSAYGKTPSRFMSSDEGALNQAAIVALRDAGARLVIEFPHIPEIKAWLADRFRSEPTTTTTDKAGIVDASGNPAIAVEAVP